MTSRALNVGLCGPMVGNTAGPATMTSRAIGVSRRRGDDGKDGRRDLPQ